MKRLPIPPPRPPLALLVGLAAIAGMAASAVLVIQHVDPGFRLAWLSALCGSRSESVPGALSPCERLNRSPASVVLGIPLALLGFAYYGAFLVGSVAVWARRTRALPEVLLFLGVCGAVVDAGLLVHSLVSARALCALCAATYGITGVLLVLSIALVRGEGGSSGVSASPPPERATWAILGLGLAAVLAAAPLLLVAARPATRLEGELLRDPDRALALAWRAFHDAYRAAPQQSVGAAGAPVLRGGGDRPLLDLVLFADFLCPHCRRAVARLGRFAREHPGDVRLAYRHFPLDADCNPRADRVHPGGCLLARAAEAARLQGRFWGFAEVVYANQEIWRRGVSGTQLAGVARGMSLDVERFEADREGAACRERVAQDVEDGNRLGIDATPALFVNGRRLASLPIDAFLEELLRGEKKDSGRSRPVRVTRLEPEGSRGNERRRSP